MKVLVIGFTDAGRRTCAAFENQNVDVVHVANPTDVQLKEILENGVDGVAVMLHNDIEVLRYSLAIEHIKPGIKLVVAIFDRSVRHEIENSIPNVTVASPAFVSIPSIVASALDLQGDAILRTEHSNKPDLKLFNLSAEPAIEAKFEVPITWKWWRLKALLRGQFVSYDSASKALLGSFFGLMAIFIIDILILKKSEKLSHAFYSAAAVISGVSAPHSPVEEWQAFQSGFFMLVTIVLVAIFGAGMVNHILTGRQVGLIGKRVIPKGQHVIVVGLGQVGIRLCKEFKLLNVSVVAVEKSPFSPGITLARDLNIPVLIGDASEVRTLKKCNLSNSKALLAMGSAEQDNIGVAVAARSLNKKIPIVIRAGNNDAIAETKSLFSIGGICDVNGLTAAFVSQSITGNEPQVVANIETTIKILTQDRNLISVASPGRCECN